MKAKKVSGSKEARPLSQEELKSAVGGVRKTTKRKITKRKKTKRKATKRS